MNTPKELIKEFEKSTNLRMKYFQVVCKDCGNDWAVFLEEGEELTPRMITCRVCAFEKAVESKIS